MRNLILLEYTNCLIVTNLSYKDNQQFITPFSLFSTETFYLFTEVTQSLKNAGGS